MKKFLKSIFSLAVVATVLGTIWVYISKILSEEDLEDDFDDDFDNLDDFEEEDIVPVKKKDKKRGYFTINLEK